MGLTLLQRILHIILSVPQKTGMDMNDVMSVASKIHRMSEDMDMILRNFATASIMRISIVVVLLNDVDTHRIGYTILLYPHVPLIDRYPRVRYMANIGRNHNKCGEKARVSIGHTYITSFSGAGLNGSLFINDFTFRCQS